MKDNLINFEVAKLAKEKGFDWSCYITYSDSNKEPSEFPILENILGEPTNPKSYQWINSKIHKNVYTAPTQSLLQKWLREVYKIHIEVAWYSLSDKWSWEIYFIESKDIGVTESDERNYDTHEEALEVGLLEALKRL